jgi:signal transduction histidine kinase
VDNLKPYKSFLIRSALLWHTAVIVFAFAAGYAVYSVLGMTMALVASIGLLVIGTIATIVGLTKPAMAPVEYLSRAILHVSSEQATSPTPDIGSIRVSKDLFQRLSSYVYDMSSSSVSANYDKQTSSIADKKPSSTTNNSTLMSSPLPFVSIDNKGIILEASQSMSTYMGLHIDKIVGQKFYDVLRFSFSSDDTLENWLKFSKDKSIVGSRTWDRVKLSLPSGDTKQLDLAVRFNSEDGAGSELTIILFDHTDKYGKDDSGASFVSMAVHELRTPLTIMRGYIEVFEEELTDKLDTEQNEFLRNLSAQAQQLGSFVSNIQNLARIENNSMDLQLKQENWPEVLTSALNDMDIRARVNHREILRSIPEDLPPVGIDRVTMYEVLVNIIENAIKYTHTDEPIKVSVTLKDQNWVETTIEDHGIGIPDSLIDHVFDKFYRSHRSSKSVGGTGVGLYLAKTIVDAHGGQIWVKSVDGKGSTFGFTIPTYESIASADKKGDNSTIERSAHGWIKNHSLYRG